MIVALTVFVWLCVGVVYCAGMVMSVAGWIAALLGVAVMLTYSVKNGIILLVSEWRICLPCERYLMLR